MGQFRSAKSVVTGVIILALLCADSARSASTISNSTAIDSPERACTGWITPGFCIWIGIICKVPVEYDGCCCDVDGTCALEYQLTYGFCFSDRAEPPTEAEMNSWVQNGIIA